MPAIEETLNSFSTIYLEELAGHSLQDRTDTKFIFPQHKLTEVLLSIRSDFSLLRIEGSGINTYETCYFDTDTLRLYHEHHNEKGNRYKIRYRQYVESKLCYFEIKFKNNKGRTLKYRIAQPEMKTDLIGEVNEFLMTHTPFQGKDLAPRLQVSYSRITLTSLRSKERLTFDIQIQASRENRSHSFDKLVIAELKQEHNGLSSFKSVMKKAGIREASLSKYCLGMAHTLPGVKKNRFKETLLSIQKTTYAS
jgi:hypothetical protein